MLPVNLAARLEHQDPSGSGLSFTASSINLERWLDQLSGVTLWTLKMTQIHHLAHHATVDMDLSLVILDVRPILKGMAPIKAVAGIRPLIFRVY